MVAKKLVVQTSLIAGLFLSHSSVFAQTNENQPRFDFNELQLVDPINTKKSPAINAEDPYESFNRAMLQFNLDFHDTVGEPLVKGYRLIPQPIRTGGENFLNNLGQPLSMLNSFLQGNIEDGLSTLMRFSINSTFGLFGILDIATQAQLEDKKEDFGQTLYVWGVWENANFVVLPFLGPTTTRGIFGKIETTVDPIYNQTGISHFYNLENESTQKSKIFAINGIAQYNQFAPLIATLENQIDPYLFAREGYIQGRVNAIYNGNPPLPKIEDDFFE